LRRWIKEQVEDGDEFRMPEIAKAAVEEFENNVEFCRQFTRDNLYQVAYDLVQSTVAMTRGRSSFKRVGDSLVNERGLEQRRRQLRSRWAAWLEHAGGRTIRLAVMTKHDLLAAAAERRSRADEEVTRAAFMEQIAATLGETERVGERYTSDQLDELWRRLTGEDSSSAGSGAA
jgi:hypothetical protein